MGAQRGCTAGPGAQCAVADRASPRTRAAGCPRPARLPPRAHVPEPRGALDSASPPSRHADHALHPRPCAGASMLWVSTPRRLGVAQGHRRGRAPLQQLLTYDKGLELANRFGESAQLHMAICDSRILRIKTRICKKAAASRPLHTRSRTSGVYSSARAGAKLLKTEENLIAGGHGQGLLNAQHLAPTREA